MAASHTWVVRIPDWLAKSARVDTYGDVWALGTMITIERVTHRPSVRRAPGFVCFAVAGKGKAGGCKANQMAGSLAAFCWGQVTAPRRTPVGLPPISASRFN